MVAVRLCIAVVGFDSFLGALDLAGHLRYRSDIWWRPDRRRDRNAERRQPPSLAADVLKGGFRMEVTPPGIEPRLRAGRGARPSNEWLG